jgi:hypothetical protein
MSAEELSPNMTSVSRYDIELAKRIACAAISHQMKVSYQHYWKNYIQTQEVDTWPIGTVWLTVAQFIRSKAFQQNNEILAWQDKELTFLQRELFNIAMHLPDSDIQLALNVLDERLGFYLHHPPVEPEDC